MLEMTFQLCYCCDWEVSAGAWEHLVLRCTGDHCSLQGAQVHLGLELFSFRALLFCLVFDCGMGCMSLSLLVKVWVLLKLQSIVFFYKVDCPLFLPFLQLFLFHFSFSWDLRLHGGLRTYRLFAFTHVVFGLVFLGGWFSR